MKRNICYFTTHGIYIIMLWMFNDAIMRTIRDIVHLTVREKNIYISIVLMKFTKTHNIRGLDCTWSIV